MTGPGHPVSETYPFALCLTRTGALTHLGIDVGHPSMAPGHPRMTLCSRMAVSLPPGADPWENVGLVECRSCLHIAPRYMHLPGWPSLVAAQSIFEQVHAQREATR